MDHDGRQNSPQRAGQAPHERPRSSGGPASQPLLVLLLDGVAFERIEHLWRQGYFRMFHRPARVISVFPTLTDPAYDAFFRCGPTPGYEAGYFDRAANRLTGAFRLYLRGANEKWVGFTDYRIGFFEDAIMYLFPRHTFRSELRRTRRVVDDCLARGRPEVVIYILSTDGLGHMLTCPKIDEMLAELDGWLVRLLDEQGGELEIVMLADHGISTTPTKRFRLRRRLRRAGLRTVKRLARPGDVAVPTFGLLDFARAHTYDDATRDRVVEVLTGCAEVELVAWRAGERVGLLTDGGQAQIRARQDGDRLVYRYQAVRGDPLGLEGVCPAMQAAGTMNDEGFAGSSAWVARTAEHDFPAAVPRLWDGMCRLSAEQPDVVVSLADGWYTGSGLLSYFVQMQGTHGGLHRRASETFAMSTSSELPSPIGLEELSEVIRRRHRWQPGERGRVADRPEKNGD